ncbi:MAG TPA: adenylyltransferase/cytidyltransferase family protein [Acidobacteriota bacterium]|nr:adenylyltransferase/cytidyltransferase family protein [Acidobacteriota bacterium]
MIIGYTTGVFDLFHIGHLNILRSAKSMCDRLLVGVSTDELVFHYKKKRPIIPFRERIEIVRSISFVDCAIRREIRDKYEEWKQFKFDITFVGNDWYQDENWERWEKELLNLGVKIIYFPNTPNQSTTKIVETIGGL